MHPKEATVSSHPKKRGAPEWAKQTRACAPHRVYTNLHATKEPVEKKPLQFKNKVKRMFLFFKLIMHVQNTRCPSLLKALFHLIFSTGMLKGRVSRSLQAAPVRDAVQPQKHAYNGVGDPVELNKRGRLISAVHALLSMGAYHESILLPGSIAEVFSPLLSRIREYLQYRIRT